MALIKLGQKPKNFAPVAVKVQMPDGSEGSVKCVFKYRTVTEFGALKEEMAKNSGFEDPTSVTWAQIYEKRRDKGGEYLLQILDSWNLDVELNHANVQQICDELPGVAIAIGDAYQAAAVEGRLGN